MRYERACSQLTAAKEMVNLAEQGYFKQSQQFDPAWQEMLNHSTMKVWHYQWPNYEGARGGLAPLKDQTAPTKHLILEGTRGPLKGPPEIPVKFNI